MAINSGLYISFTAAELVIEWDNYKAAVKARTAGGGKEIVSASVGGKSFSYQYPAGVSSLDEWRDALTDAQRQLTGETRHPMNKTAMRFY